MVEWSHCFSPHFLTWVHKSAIFRQRTMPKHVIYTHANVLYNVIYIYMYIYIYDIYYLYLCLFGPLFVTPINAQLPTVALFGDS